MKPFSNFGAWIALLCVLGAGDAWADHYVIKTLNLIPDICGTIESQLERKPGYIASASESGELFPHRINSLEPVNWGSELRWNEFREEYPPQFQAFLDEGLSYGRGYVVHKSSVSLYGDYKGTRVYMLRYLVSPHSEKPPRLFIREQDGNLDEVFNALGASDILKHSDAHSYPIVREPGRVEVYKVTAVETSPDDKQKKIFRADPVCAFGLSPDYRGDD